MSIPKPLFVCCEMMQAQLDWSCDQHESQFDCPDAIIDYSQVFDEYGIIIHDGGCSSILIQYCPWCSQKLPDSKRYKWFEELKKLGYEEVGLFDADIPEEFKSNAWYENNSDN